MWGLSTTVSARALLQQQGAVEGLLQVLHGSAELSTMPDPDWNELYIADGKCSDSQRDTLQVCYFQQSGASQSAPTRKSCTKLELACAEPGTAQPIQVAAAADCDACCVPVPCWPLRPTYLGRCR